MIEKATEPSGYAEEPKPSDRAGLAQSLYDEGLKYASSGKFEEALAKLEKAQKIFEELERQNEIANSYHQIGIIQQTRGDGAAALAAYQKALSLFEQLNDRDGVARSQHQIGLIHQARGDYAKAQAAFEKSLELAESLNDRPGVVVTLSNLGALAQEQGDSDKARRFYQQSLAMAREIGDRLGEAQLLHNLGVLAQTSGEYGLAKQLYQESLSIKEELADKHGIAATLYQLGTLAQLNDNHAEAHRLLEKALTIAREIGDKSNEKQIAGILGNVAFELGLRLVNDGSWYDGLRLLEESLAIRRQGDDLDARADAICQIARTHHLMDNLHESRIHYRDALRLYQHTANQRGMASCKTGLGRVMLEMGFIEEALDELKQAKRIYHQLGEKRRISEIEEIMQLANHVNAEQIA
jgi:tetratricopeptide (TPR) repeat protein